jgi:diacylglycerol kinase family enzyme
MRIALAANTASGGGLDPGPLADAMRAAGASVDVGGCEPASLAGLAASRPDRLVVAGGDGTIGPVADLAGRLGVPLAVLPAGTANDFARANGLPADPEEAATLAVRGSALRRLDLGRLADGRAFVNVASAGLAATAARRAHPLKPRLGALAYAAAALHVAVTERPVRARVRIDGAETFAGACWQLMVAVTGAFGAGSAVPAADPSDGRLTVHVVTGSRLTLGYEAFVWRRMGSDPDLQSARRMGSDPLRGRVVEVELADGAGINVDGEARSGGLERVTLEPAAFALVVG